MLDCARTDADPKTIAELRRTFAEWRDALAEGDLEGLAGLLTEDAEFWTQDQERLVGRDAARSAFEPIFAAYTLEQDFECVELVAVGDLALVRGVEVNRLVSRDGSETRRLRQRAFSVLRREGDGVWRFARGMTHLPPADR